MTSYLVTIATTITKLASKSARGMNEQLLKTSRADVLSSRKKLRKTLWRVGGMSSPPSPLYVRGLISWAQQSCYQKIFSKKTITFLIYKRSGREKGKGKRIPESEKFFTVEYGIQLKESGVQL